MALPPILKHGSDYIKQLVVRDVVTVRHPSRSDMLTDRVKRIFRLLFRNQAQGVMSQTLLPLLWTKATISW